MIFGGVGSGLYGMLIFVVIAVFVAGLMVGRTPEYLGKKIEAREMKLAVLGALFVPTIVLVTDRGRDRRRRRGLAPISTRAARLQRDPLRLRVAGEQQRLRVRGLTARRTSTTTLGALAMLLGRFVLIVAVLALAGTLARKKHVPPRPGRCRPTRRSSSACSSA